MLLFIMFKTQLTQQQSSRIDRYPFFIRPILVLVRNLILRVGAILPPYAFNEDGMGTNHNISFLRDEKFLEAYEYARSNVPFDYGIKWRVHQAIWLSNSAASRFPDSIFVELGTGRGFIMQSVMHYLENNFGNSKIPQTYLFDSFLPHNTDGISTQSSQLGFNKHYSSGLAETLKNFERWEGIVHLVSGTLPGSLKDLPARAISFLHVDLNAGSIEADCLNYLWSQIPIGGVILLDDFANAGFVETTEPVRQFFRDKSQYVLHTPSGQGIVIKS